MAKLTGAVPAQMNDYRQFANLACFRTCQCDLKPIPATQHAAELLYCLAVSLQTGGNVQHVRCCLVSCSTCGLQELISPEKGGGGGKAKGFEAV